ncbi:hypothetical protein JXB28_06410 [Candidatus Woesearchaeota archaeon]|nr:hypothetical protein [Candidatus Woesearchaeota archaeon]
MATLYVLDVYDITGIGLVVTGKVEHGSLRIGMRGRAQGKLLEAKSIEVHHEQLAEAKEGDFVGVSVAVSSINQGLEGGSFLKKLFSGSGDLKFLQSLKGKRVEFI